MAEKGQKWQKHGQTCFFCLFGPVWACLGDFWEFLGLIFGAFLILHQKVYRARPGRVLGGAVWSVFSVFRPSRFFRCVSVRFGPFQFLPVRFSFFRRVSVLFGPFQSVSVSFHFFRCASIFPCFFLFVSVFFQCISVFQYGSIFVGAFQAFSVHFSFFQFFQFFSGTF